MPTTSACCQPACSHSSDNHSAPTAITTIHPPPKLLLGTALLFWGLMTGHGVLSVVLALIVEGAHWLRMRWDFDEADCIRAWHLVIAATAMAMVFIWIDGNPYLTVPTLLGWLPPLLLPLQFVQSFGLRQAIPVRTFSFFTRKQRERNHRHGLAFHADHINFGYAYLVIVMVASTPLGERPDSWLFLPGLVVLTMWALAGCGRCRPVQVLPCLLVAGGIAFAGQVALTKAYNWLTLNSLRGRDDFLNPNHYRTAIGRLGEIKQSSKIIWRVRPESNNPAPTHLRGTCYNRYRAGLWNNIMPADSQAAESDFKPLVPLATSGTSVIHPLRASAGQQSARPSLPRFALRGAATANSPLPLPGNAASLRDFEVDVFECNSLGTVRMFPREPVIDGSVAWGDTANPETPPWLATDLDVHAGERAVLRQVLTELKVAAQPTLAAKLEVLRRFFRKFQYTRYNTIKPPNIGILNGPTAIGVFLTTARRGHCEYFATAAALLLREAGIPTRYAVGYAVMEHDPKRNEWVVRGLHGHAWTRVWDESNKLWIDFDPTPPGWLAAETGDGWSLQWFMDWFQRAREDFALWRGRPRNRMILSGVMLVIGVGGLAFILRRLWRSKSTLETPREHRVTAPPTIITPLHLLEKSAAKYLPPRPPGQPFGQWISGLRQYLTDFRALDEAITLHQQLRFDPAPPAPPDNQRLKELTRMLESALGRL